MRVMENVVSLTSGSCLNQSYIPISKRVDYFVQWQYCYGSLVLIKAALGRNCSKHNFCHVVMI